MTVFRPSVAARRPRLWWPFAVLAAAVLLAPPSLIAQDAESTARAGAEESAPPADPNLAPITDEITVTATRTPRSLQEVPGAVSVIEAEEIEAQGMENVRDLVRFEPGIYVNGDLTRLGLGGFNIRGIGGNRVATRVDGVATAEQFEFGPVAVNRYSLDLDFLKRVEIVRSAGSALYGSDALGGVVSFETKDPLDLLTQPGGRSAISLKGAYDGRDEGFSQMLATALGGRRWQGALFAGRTSARELDNFGTVETRNATRTAPNPQDRQSLDGLFKLTHQRSDRNSFKLTAELFDGETDTEVLSLQGRANLAPGLPPGAVAYVDTNGYDAVDSRRRQRLSLEQSLTGSGGGLFDRIGWRVFLQSNVTEQDVVELRQTVQGGGPLGPLRTTNVSREGRTRFDQEGLGGELELQKALLGDRAGDGAGRRATHLFTYGASWIEDRFDQWRDRADRNLDTGNPDVYPGPLIFPTKYFPASDVRKSGLFLQDEMDFASGRFRIIPGIRYDRYELRADDHDAVFLSGNQGTPAPADVTDAAWSPRLGLVARLTGGVSAFAQYAHGFRAPAYSSVNNGFTNLASGYTTLPNPGLEPETSDNYELGLRGAGSRASWSAVVFHNRYEDFIELVTLGFNPATGLLEFQPQNVDQVVTSGVELSGQASFAGAWTVLASLALLEGENENLDVPLNSIPPATLNLGLRYGPVTRPWGAQLSLTAVRQKEEGDVDRSVVDQYAPPGYEVVDVVAHYNFARGFSLQLGVLNLFDEEYWQWADVLGRDRDELTLDRYTSPGRAASFAVRWRR